jgi:uncharacterized membrane protein
MSETNTSGLSENAIGAIAYVTFLPAIVFLILPPYNANPYIRFHAWQSILLNVVAFVVSFALSFALMFGLVFGSVLMIAIPRLISICWILLWILCAIAAVNGKRLKLPIVGPLAEKLAAK